jgi:hypothetical protein
MIYLPWFILVAVPLCSCNIINFSGSQKLVDGVTSKHCTKKIFLLCYDDKVVTLNSWQVWTVVDCMKIDYLPKEPCSSQASQSQSPMTKWLVAILSP